MEVSWRRTPQEEERGSLTGAHLRQVASCLYLEDLLTITWMTGGHCEQALISAQAKSS